NSKPISHLPATASRTRTPSGTTSFPIPSPGITAILVAIHFHPLREIGPQRQAASQQISDFSELHPKIVRTLTVECRGQVVAHASRDTLRPGRWLYPRSRRSKYHGRHSVDAASPQVVQPIPILRRGL